MKSGINLKLPKKRVSLVAKRLYSISIGLFLVSVIISIALIAINLYFKTTIDSLSNERDVLKNKILSQNTKLYKLYDTHERLKSIEKILVGRAKTSDKIEIVSTVVPEETDVVGIEGDVEKIDFTVSTKDLSQINSLLQQKLLDLASQTDKDVKTIEMKSLVLSSDTGEYTLYFEVTL